MKKLLCMVVLLGFCGTAGAALADEAVQPLPKPGVLNEETIFTDKRLSLYDTIILREFKTEGATYENLDEDAEKTKLEAMKPLLVRTLVDSTEVELKIRKMFKNIQKGGEAKGSAVILEGSFTEFNGGSRAVRFWVGFGAGKTYLKIKGRLIDAQSGKELATFEDQETGYKGMATMESFSDLFPHQAKSCGENIADFIQKLY